MDDTTAAGDELLSHLEETGRWVAYVTGVKQQLVDAGWSARGAEKMVHTLMSVPGR